MVLVLLALLGNVPTLSLAHDSDCPSELRATSLPLGGGAVELSLAKHRLTLKRGAEVVLSRDLGPGTCAEASRAAVVIVERWATSIQSSPRPTGERVRERGEDPRPFEPAPTRDAGSPPQVTPPQVTPPQVTPPQVTPPQVTPPQVTPPQVTPPQVVTPPLPDPLPDGAREGVDAGPEVSRAVSESEPVDAGPASPVDAGTPAPNNLHFEALVGGGLFLPAAPALSADVALVLNHRFRFNVTGLYDFGGTTAVFDEANLQRGSLTHRGGLVLPGAALCFDFFLRGCAGVLVGARIVEGTASGTYVFHTGTQRLGALVLGPTLQLAFISGWFHAALDASLLITPVPPALEVEGLTPQVRPPVVQGLLRLSIGLGGDP